MGQLPNQGREPGLPPYCLVTCPSLYLSSVSGVHPYGELGILLLSGSNKDLPLSWRLSIPILGLPRPGGVSLCLDFYVHLALKRKHYPIPLPKQVKSVETEGLDNIQCLIP